MNGNQPEVQHNTRFLVYVVLIIFLSMLMVGWIIGDMSLLEKVYNAGIGAISSLITYLVMRKR